MQYFNENTKCIKTKLLKKKENKFIRFFIFGTPYPIDKLIHCQMRKVLS